jgi:hypothetical protein
MKKLIYKLTFPWQLLLIIAAVMFTMSCEDENEFGAPAIAEVRNYAASPNDTLITTLNAGQWVVLLGNNLSGIYEVYFAGTPASINTALFAKGSLVVQVPAIDFESVPVDRKDEVMVVSNGGTATYQINIVGPPSITRVRNFDDSPNDTLLNQISPGQEINIIGYNLEEATEISFQGIPADLGGLIYTDSSAIITVPSNLSGGSASLANMISYTTIYGSTTFSIKIVGPPVVVRVSNENPVEGDSVFLYGDNLLGIEELTFAGVTIAAHNVNADGTRVGFVVPALSASGPVAVTTEGGTFTSSYNVNDIVSGGISNFEWSGPFQWAWWGGANLECGNPSSGWPPYNPDFPGNPSQYLVLKSSPMNPGDGAEWSTAIRMENVQWLPVENLSDPIDAWVIKFEMNVPEDWNGITITVTTSNGSAYRYEPWKMSAGSQPFKTKGWQTISIPLSSFRASDGTGAPITSLINLLGSEGKSNMFFVMKNYGTGVSATGFNGAFDNFRVIKP